MPVDHIRYDLLAQDALRGVIRKLLADVAVRGLPGEHHFYITFDTRTDGVHISDRLREKYPEEMTIVLQYQFWDLKVTDHGFEVGVSFNGVPERLAVPFSAIKGFFDPSVQFGLQFELASEAPAEKQVDRPAAPTPERSSRSARRGAASEPEETRPKRGSVPATSVKSAPPAATKPTEKAEPAETETSAEVVSLDKFRKK